MSNPRLLARRFPPRPPGWVRALGLVLAAIALLVAAAPAAAGEPGHWAFRRPERPAIPQVRNRDWPINPIDHFVLADLERRGLAPRPEASRSELWRRASLAIIGLPPELDLVPQRSTAGGVDGVDGVDDYIRWVDQLLSRPEYGEHQARYWLDAARYGDTHGLNLDNERSSWPYRDWVIHSFNANQPFDEFTIEQLAGDLLESPTIDQLVATGFHRCNVTTGENGAIGQEYLAMYMADRVETTATIWMGLTVQCARCHDHKHDPITQREYYQLAAYFGSLTEQGLDDNALAPPPTVKAPTRLQRQEIERHELELAAIERRLAALSAGASSQTAHVDTAHVNTAIGEAAGGEAADGEAADVATPDVETRLRERALWLERTLQRIRSDIPRALVMEELSSPRPTHVLDQGHHDRPLEEVQPGVPAFLPPLPPGAPPNRLALARWLVSPDHPLTARVVVNRIWQQYFGVGLVKTSEDFGLMGEPPSHPELLDWLAVELMSNGWNVKAIHRLIATSTTFRQQSSAEPAAFADDPENRWLARGSRFRLDAEVLRDQALAVSGLLAREVGGPSVRPYQPAGIWERVAHAASTTAHYEPDKGPGLYRRGIYTFWKRTAPPPTMLLLDAPSRETCVVRRARSNTPTAALALMNDVQMVEAARVLAERVLRDAGPDADDRARLEWLYRRALFREPSDNQWEMCRALLDQSRDHFRTDPAAADQLIHVGESGVDESLDPAELAVWTVMANMVLNLDEFLSLN